MNEHNWIDEIFEHSKPASDEPYTVDKCISQLKHILLGDFEWRNSFIEKLTVDDLPLLRTAYSNDTRIIEMCQEGIANAAIDGKFIINRSASEGS